MAQPTKTELFTQFSNANKIYDQLFLFSAENVINYNDLEDIFIVSLKGDHARTILNNINSLRNSLNANILSAQNTIVSILQQIARVGYSISITGLSTQQVITRIFEEMELATDTIASRVMTFGAIAPDGSNQMTGTVYRTAIDRNNDNIESGQEGIVRFEIIQDKNNGLRPGNEQMRIIGSGITKIDEIELGTATNLTTNIILNRADNGILKNPSFDQIQDVVNTAEQNGWTLGSNLPGEYEKVTATADLFRFTPNQETAITQTGSALKLKANNTSIVQYFTRERLSVSSTPDIPMFLIFRVKRLTLADGDLEIRIGQSSFTVDLTTLTNNVYSDVVVGPGTDDGYFDNFNEDFVDPITNQALGIRIKAEWTSRTVGEIILDEVIFKPATLFNGIHYLSTAGSNTQATSGEAQVGDFFTFTDTSSNTGRNQYQMYRIFGRHLPHTGVPSIPDA